MKSFLFLAFSVITLTGFCQPNCLVTRVIDGDTYKVLYGGKIETVRLLNVDAPEIGQYFGVAAKDNVTAFMRNRMVEATLYETDLFGRRLVSIHVDGMSLDSLLIAKGWAFYYYKYSRNKELAVLETAAKSNRAGIWYCLNNVPPWIWRKLSKYNKRMYGVCRPLPPLPGKGG